jgi:hypothetical protein
MYASIDTIAFILTLNINVISLSVKLFIKKKKSILKTKIILIF